MNDVTRILCQIEQGDGQAAEKATCRDPGLWPRNKGYTKRSF
jgi:hypothetical protein